MQDKRNNQERVYGTIGRAVLATVASAGVLGLALVAPGALQLLATGVRMSQSRARRKVFPSDIRTAVRSLEKRGLIRISQSQAGGVTLTERGKTELLKYQLQEKLLAKQRWDGKWRLIIFDIEERRRRARDKVRQELRSFGLIKLQESVWVYPYDCEEVIVLLKAENHVSRNVLYVVAGEIEGDSWLRKKFGLK